MNNKSEFFDLKREKRELDDFLSTLEEESSVATKVVAQTEAPPSSPAESKSSFEDTYREISGLELERSVVKPEEAPGQPTLEDKTLMPADFLSEPTDTVLQKPDQKATPEPEAMPLEMETPALELEGASAQSAQEGKAVVPGDDQPVSRFADLSATPEAAPPEERKTSSFLSLGHEEKKEALSPISGEQDVPSPESLETMTKTGSSVPAETPPPVEEKILKKPAPEKKKSKSNAIDFAPESESSGAGKWIGIGMAIILLIALLVWYFLFYSAGGGKTIKNIQSYVPVFKAVQGPVSPAVQGVNLIQIRQKLVYNATLGKNIRVIEGLTENSTDRPVSKIKVVASVFNKEGALLASAESFAGNVIIDEKLESLDAKGILAALKDMKTMEDRASPKGQMPFMVVLTSEPAGVFKLAVLPVDFKKH